MKLIETIRLFGKKIKEYNILQNQSLKDRYLLLHNGLFVKINRAFIYFQEAIDRGNDLPKDPPLFLLLLNAYTHKQHHTHWKLYHQGLHYGWHL
jgi:hypothetical protein